MAAFAVATPGHKERAHSRIGPSAAHRWIPCPASIIRSQNRPNSSNFFAQEGTAAHELCEHVMSKSVDPRAFLGGIINLKPDARLRVAKRHQTNEVPDGWDVWEITEEMVEAVELYRDTFLPFIRMGYIASWECRLDMRHIHPDLFGTGDALLYNPKTRHLIVGDFKYGSGVLVEVKDNEQLLTYGVGALAVHGSDHVSRVTLIIVQPRMDHADGPVRSQEVSIERLLEFQDYLRKRAALTDDEEAEVCAGHWCIFCPVAGFCREYRDYVFNRICLFDYSGEYGMLVSERQMPALKDLSPDELGEIVVEAKIIERWIKRVLEYAHERALGGSIPTGSKLVKGRAYRRFTDPEDAMNTLSWMYDEETYMQPPTMKSPAQIEGVIGKKALAQIFGPDDIKAETNKLVLAPLDDPRPAVTVQRGEAFGAVEDED
jgi:hypothetical protein